MADDLRMALTNLLRKAEMAGDVDFLRDGVRILGQTLMTLRFPSICGRRRTSGRRNVRDIARTRQWDTRVGTVDLQVPRVRDGSFFPSLLEPRRRAERALVGVVQEAYVQGVSTRPVDELVKALGMTGISKSQFSRLCEELDAEVERFRSRRLCEELVRQEGRVVSTAVVIAIGVTATGEREVLGLDVGPSEDGEFWLQFLRRLVSRALRY